MVHYFCKSGHIDLAPRFFHDMIEKGISYGALINGLCKAFRVSETMNLYEDMRTKGLSPDNLTYTLLIGGLVQENMVVLACRIWTI